MYCEANHRCCKGTFHKTIPVSLQQCSSSSPADSLKQILRKQIIRKQPLQPVLPSLAPSNALASCQGEVLLPSQNEAHLPPHSTLFPQEAGLMTYSLNKFLHLSEPLHTLKGLLCHVFEEAKPPSKATSSCFS